MADTKWTKEQERAISDRGKGIIVSAAAGSGKTTVLIERMIQLLSDEKNKITCRQTSCSNIHKRSRFKHERKTQPCF